VPASFRTTGFNNLAKTTAIQDVAENNNHTLL